MKFINHILTATLLLSTALIGEEKEEKVTIADKLKNTREFKGLFDLYQDNESGDLFLLLNTSQLGKTYLHFAYVENGVVEAGLFRGRFRGSRLVELRRHFDHVEWVHKNDKFYFDPDNAISRAAKANVSEAILASMKIIAEDAGKKQLLVQLDDVFLSEAMLQVKPSPDPDAKKDAFTLGELNSDKSKFEEIRSYPENTDLVVTYVYDNKAPTNRGGIGITDARSISITVQHSLIALPMGDFTPRGDDPRVGYFMTQINDMTSTSYTPWRDMIHRWKLEKQDPSAELSEPKQPIVWWIENTTPEDLRSVIKDAVETWNVAFEAAGFRNAVVVNIQPDDADWDAGDIRYNVLRWTSSPQPPFGGYGPSFVNPMTGQILGADIMLEWVFLSNRVKYDFLFDDAAGPDLEPEYLTDDPYFCSAGHELHLSNMLGVSVLNLDNAGVDAKRQLVEEGLRYLLMHEVGHTLGLNHNMKSSQLHPLSNIHDADLTRREGLTGSVMDYPAINVALDRDQQGQYYNSTLGPYDIWAITFGYAPGLDDAEARSAHLARSTEHQLAFGNDADDMRAPGRHLDPRVNTGDMTSDAIPYAVERIELVRRMMGEIQSKYSETDGSYSDLRSTFNLLTAHHQGAVNVISRYIGGLYVDRAFAGQSGAEIPFRPVEKSKQKQAMKALEQYLFAPNAFSESADLLSYLQNQRRGFDHFGENEDPHLHDRVLGVQKRVLDHLMHANTLERVTDTQLYGNEYPVGELLSDLSVAIFKADVRGNVNSYRQNLQIEYVQRLIDILKGDSYDYVSRSAALQEIARLRRLVDRKSGNAQSQAHRLHLAYIIDQGLDKD
ncbi:MAG: zinc-dependent metalloprotease [Candidatus Marinimicrobia bacterium]|nr:zinc-dependent metalloprotease [Candidatus Neomarinimicrobiota bacterium]